MWHSLWAKTNRSRPSVHYVKAHSERKPTDQCHYSNTWSSLCGDNEQWRWANLVKMFKGQWCRAKTKNKNPQRHSYTQRKGKMTVIYVQKQHPVPWCRRTFEDCSVWCPYMFQDSSTWCQHNYVSRLFNLMSTYVWRLFNLTLKYVSRLATQVWRLFNLMSTQVWRLFQSGFSLCLKTFSSEG